jgi:hypothetical protein
MSGMLPALLRARGERPRNGRAAEQSDELAAFHSITSSARTRNDSGYGQPKRLGGGQVDNEVVLGRLLDGQVGGLCAMKNLIDEIGGAPVQRLKRISVLTDSAVRVSHMRFPKITATFPAASVETRGL